jgi:hypothetical protein
MLMTILVATSRAPDTERLSASVSCAAERSLAGDWCGVRLFLDSGYAFGGKLLRSFATAWFTRLRFV